MKLTTEDLHYSIEYNAACLYEVYQSPSTEYCIV